jgi:hypothetical protein
MAKKTKFVGPQSPEQEEYWSMCEEARAMRSRWDFITSLQCAIWLRVRVRDGLFWLQHPRYRKMTPAQREAWWNDENDNPEHD